MGMSSCFFKAIKATGTEKEIKEQFRIVRDLIKKYSKTFVEENL